MSDPFLIFVTDPKRKDTPISFGLTRIGRASASEIQINDANVSKAHCILIRTEQGVCVYDFSSRNGTFVGREKAEGQRLKDGDEIVLGEHWRLLYVEDQSALVQGPVAEKPTLPQQQKKLRFAHVLPWIIAAFCGIVAFFPHSNENPHSKEISAIQQEVILHQKQITQQEDTIAALQNKMQEQQQQVTQQQRTIERKKNLLALTQEQLRLVRKQRDRLLEKWENAKKNRENKDKVVDEKQAKPVEEKEVQAKEEEVVDKDETVVEVVEKKDRPQIKNKVQETSKSTYDLEALTKKLITVLESYAFPTISSQSLQPMLTQLSSSSSLEAAKKMLQLVDYSEELNKDLHKNITFLEKRVQQLLDLAKHKQNMSRDDLEKHQRLLELSQKKAEIQKRQQQRLLDLQKSIIEDFSKLQDVAVTEYLVTKINKRDEARSLAILNALGAATAKHSIPKLIAMLPVKNTAIHDKVIATLSQITSLPFSTAKQWKKWWSKQDNK